MIAHKTSEIGPAPAIGAQAFARLRDQLQQANIQLAREKFKREEAKKKLLAQEAGAKKDIEKGVMKQVRLSSDLQSCIAENEALRSQVKFLSDTTEESAIENLNQQIASEVEEKKKLLTENECLRYANFNLNKDVARLSKEAKDNAREFDRYRASTKEQVRQADEEVKRANAAHSPEWLRQQMRDDAVKAETTIKLLREDCEPRSMQRNPR